MNRIILILPWFGKRLPHCWNFYWESCRRNREIDFLILTDCEVAEAKNIRVIKFTFQEFKSFVQSKFDFPIALDTPYKLCDFKPAYGYIFNEYISNYQYWGHCDCDLIWGNLSVLNTIIQKGYERIGEYGHLILYKNTEEVNSWFKTLNALGIPSYKEVYACRKNRSFDEFSGMNVLVRQNNKSVYTERLFDDVIFYKKNFWTRRKIAGKDTKWNPTYFTYDKGELRRYVLRKGKWMSDTSLYVHFQKRKLSVETENTNEFMIIPNRILPIYQYTSEELKQITAISYFDTEYWTMCIKAKVHFLIKKIWK